MTWKPFRPPSVDTDSVKLRDSMEQVAKKLGTAGPGKTDVIFDQWLTTVGGDTAHQTVPTSLVDGVLTVWVLDATHMPTLKWQTGTVKERINAAAGAEVVKKVEFRVKR